MKPFKGCAIFFFDCECCWTDLQFTLNHKAWDFQCFLTVNTWTDLQTIIACIQGLICLIPLCRRPQLLSKKIKNMSMSHTGALGENAPDTNNSDHVFSFQRVVLCTCHWACELSYYKLVTSCNQKSCLLEITFIYYFIFFSITSRPQT